MSGIDNPIIPNKRPTRVALDLPKSKYKGRISRDEHMASEIAKIFKSDPNAEILVILGNNHIFKFLSWQDHVPNKHKSIREYLDILVPNLKMVSIAQVIGDSLYEDDFRQRLSQIDGAVALGLDERYVGWKSSIGQSMAV